MFKQPSKLRLLCIFSLMEELDFLGAKKKWENTNDIFNDKTALHTSEEVKFLEYQIPCVQRAA